MLLIVIFTIILIPQQTSELLTLYNIQSSYMTKDYLASEGVRHILVSGYVGIEPLKSFCKELFHEDHGTQNPTHAVLMQNCDPKPPVIMYMLSLEL